MTEEIILFPFGGNAKEILVSLLSLNEHKPTYKILGFIDDELSNFGKEIYGIKVLGGKEILNKFSNSSVIAVPGNPK